MAEITLADYTGYIFLEIMKARGMADQYAKAVAEQYAKDPVLGHFSVPRFKTPKMTLTIPVLISGARYNQVVSFRMPAERFVAAAEGRIEQVLGEVRDAEKQTPPPRGTDVDPVIKDPKPPIPGRPSKGSRSLAAIAARALDPKMSAMIRALHQELEKNPDPTQPQALVQKYWYEIFFGSLELAGLGSTYKKYFPRNELFKPSIDDILKLVTTATVIDSTSIQSLLINPETNVVKNGSSDSSVFTIQAELVEEGFFIRTVRDPNGGPPTQVVEFE